jgi:hypothetical protein
MNRREAIKIAAVAVALPAAAQPAKPLLLTPLFFTPEEFQAVDALTELIIPTDDHSPGARAAKVAEYIDKRLAESFEPEPPQIWRAGLKLYLSAPQSQWMSILTALAENEFEAKTPDELFFKELKGRTVQAYYGSAIGIHQEMEYKGNTYQDVYSGFDAK